MDKMKTLIKIFKLSEYVKLEGKKNHENYHHPLKNNLTKSHNRILGVLQRHGTLNQRTLSKHLNISPQAVSETIKKLECDNLIYKDDNGKINLTKTGNDYAVDFNNRVTAHAEELLKDFTDEELQNVINFIDKLLPKEEYND